MTTVTPTDFTWVTANDPNYEHHQRIDVGGYGQVHKLKDLIASQLFARKLVLSPSSTPNEDTLKEQKALIKLCRDNSQHNIVKVLRHGTLGNTSFYYFDMELCDFNLHTYIYQEWGSKEELADQVPFLSRVDSFGPLARISQLWNIMVDIGNGVAFVHTSGYVHRDVKPKNVLYSIPDKGWKVADFGLTVEGTSNRALSTQESKGTPGYRAPELLSDRSNHFTNKCDIWAIGVILYELVHREKPFVDDHSVRTYYDRLSAGQPIDVPIKFLAESLQQTLNGDPASRPSARELTKSFKSILMETLSNAVGAVSIEKACRERQHVTIPEINLEALRDIGSQRTQVVTQSGPLDSSRQPPNVRGGRVPTSYGATQNFPLDLGSLLSQLTLTPRPQVPDNAVRTLESTLEIRKRTLGVQHPTTLKSMKTLGERSEAASGVYKPDNASMLLIKNDLALAYSRVFKFEDAARIGEELCENMIGVWAPEDLNFLTMRYNLGYYYEFLGKLSQAAELYEEVIEKGRPLMDEGHRNMMLAMIGLESVYWRMGRVSDAVRICSGLVEIKEKVYGPDHASTLQDMGILVQYYKRLRRYSEAVALNERIVSIRTRVNGEENTQTLSAKAELAEAYIADQKLDKAQEILRETLPIRKRVQGEEHPDTLQNMDDLCLLEFSLPNGRIETFDSEL